MAESETVIIALKFEGGAILGADSQASDDYLGVRWMVEKPFQIPAVPCVSAMSGSVGMITRVKEDLLGHRWLPHTFDKVSRVRGTVDSSFVKIYKENDARNARIQLVGLTIFWAEEDAHILEHETSRDCCFHPHFHAIGSGAKTAYAIYRTLGGRELVGVGEQKAIQAALRILSTCVDVEGSGVSDPYHLWVIKAGKAAQISPDQIEAEMQYVEAWQRGDIARFFQS